MGFMKKRYVTLIELMIAMGLAMALLSFALYFYRYGVFMEAELKKEEAEAFKERIFTGRLTSIFSRLSTAPFFTMEEQPGLTIGPSLVFSFESEALSPTFHGPVVARLLIDPQKRLLMTLWQYNSLREQSSPSPIHVEVLAENEEKIGFQFLMGINNESQNLPEWRPGFFLSNWKSEYKMLPSAIKISFGKKEFAFPIASCPPKAAPPPPKKGGA